MTACEVCGGPCDSKYAVCRENKDCRREYQRRVQRKYVAANQDAVRERAREFYRAHPERQKEYRQNNLEEAQARDRAWYWNNREKKSAYSKARYQANPEPILERARQWQRDNPERARASRESYLQNNLEEIEARRKERYEANREQLLEEAADRRSAMRSTVPGMADLMFTAVRSRARKRGLPFDLTTEWLESELTLALESGCPLLGIEISMDAAPRSPGSPSIDKFRAELGYVQGNCWILSFAANDMKHDMTIDFMQRVLAMADTRFGDAAAWYATRDPLSVENAGDLDALLRRKARMLRAGARSRATAGGLPFNLTVKWAERELASAVENGCPLLGIDLRLDSRRIAAPDSPSIDRFHPDRGYMPGNCWIISHRANTMKRNASLDFMRRILEAADTRFAVG